ncbi:hypothetical protein V8E36_008346, partial [Tilletia maclaganii]
LELQLFVAEITASLWLLEPLPWLEVDDYDPYLVSSKAKMFERRDTPRPSATGTHAPDFITHLAYASIALPVLFLIVAGIWIIIRFGSSNVSPADLTLSGPLEGEDGDLDDLLLEGEEEKEKARDTVGGSRRIGAMQPLLESDEDDDRDDAPLPTAKIRPTRQSKQSRSPRSSTEKSKDAEPTASAAKWKLKSGYSTTTISSSAPAATSRKSKR